MATIKSKKDSKLFMATPSGGFVELDTVAHIMPDGSQMHVPPIVCEVRYTDADSEIARQWAEKECGKPEISLDIKTDAV